MSDYISREELLKHQYRIDDSASLSTRDVVNVEDIEDCPPADVRENVRGKWIYPNNCSPISSPLYNHPYMWKSICSNCNTGFPTINKNYKFCPECGADMRGET